MADVGPNPNSPAALAALKAAGVDRNGQPVPQWQSSGDPEIDYFEKTLGPNYSVYRDTDGSIMAVAIGGEDAIDYAPKPITLKSAPAKSSGSGNALGFGQLAQAQAEFEYGKGRDTVKDAQFQQQFAAEQAAADRAAALQERKMQLDALEGAQNRMIQQAALLENATMSRAQLKEQARQFGIQQTMQTWQTAMSVIPQLGQLSLQESERVQKILENGTHFISAAWESRGEQSPLARVTQADQINAVKASMNAMRDFLTNIPPVYIPEIDTPEMPFFGAAAPAAAPAQGAPAAPAANVPNSGGAGSPFAQTATYDENGNVTGWATVGSPNTTAHYTAPAGSGFGAYGPVESASVAVAAPSTPAYVPNMTPPTFNLANNMPVDLPPTGPMPVSGSSAPPTLDEMTPAAAGLRDPWAVPSPPPPGSNFGAFFNDPFNRSGERPSLWDVLADPFRRSDTTGRGAPGPKPSTAPFGSRAPYGTAPMRGYAKGGSVPAGEPVVVGEDGYEVMRTNPDGTAEVLEHSKAKKLVTKDGKLKGAKGDLKGYAEGTWGATAAIQAFNAGNQGAISSFNSGNTGGSFGSYSGSSPAPAQSYGAAAPAGAMSREAYDNRLAGMKAAYPGFNFMDYNTAHGLDAMGRPIPQLQYGYNPDKVTPQAPRVAQTAGVDFGALLKRMFPNSDMISQEQLITEAEKVMPPGIRDVLAGKMPAPYRLPFEAPTARQLSTLTQAERDALGNYTGLKHNIGSAGINEATSRLFGVPTGAARRAMITGMGI